MKNKLYIIASWFLCFGTCCAVPTAHVLTTAKSATPFMSRMQNYARVGAFFLSARIAGAAAETVTNSISHHLFRQDQAAENSKVSLYARKGLSVASSILTQAGISWALLPFLFPQKRHTFQYWSALTAASVLTDAVTQRAVDYCLSKFSNKSTKKLLLSLGLVFPAVAGLEYLSARMPYSIMRSCTGVGESPLIPASFCILTALLTIYDPTNTCVSNGRLMIGAFGRFKELIEKIQQNPTNPANVELWQQVGKEVDAIELIFTDERYSFAGLNSNELIIPYVRNCFLEDKEAVFNQLIKLYKMCPENVLKGKLAAILFPPFIRDVSSEIAAGEEMLGHEEQTLAYLNELNKKHEGLKTLGKHAVLLLESFSPDQNEVPDRIEIRTLAEKMEELTKRMFDKMKFLAKNPEVETESIAKDLEMIESKIAHTSSSLKKLSIASTSDQVSELKTELGALAGALRGLEADKLVVSENRLKVKACVVPMVMKFMWTLERKFTFISQQLEKTSLSHQELINLSSYFQTLDWLMKQGVVPFVQYLNQGGRALFDHVSALQGHHARFFAGKQPISEDLLLPAIEESN